MLAQPPNLPIPLREAIAQLCPRHLEERDRDVKALRVIDLQAKKWNSLKGAVVVLLSTVAEQGSFQTFYWTVGVIQRSKVTHVSLPLVDSAARSRSTWLDTGSRRPRPRLAFA